MYSPLPEVIRHNMRLEPSEMCFVQYLPIYMPGEGPPRIPDNLQWTNNFVMEVMSYLIVKNIIDLKKCFVYLTAKHLWVTPDNIGNRPGWHIDGYLSEDINIIWSDKYPTEICVQEFNLTPDHHLSMVEMNEQVKVENVITFSEGDVVLLTPDVVHRPPIISESGMRTFLKISVSKDKYNLKGNAHNYLFNYDWEMVERKQERNHPSA